MTPLEYDKTFIWHPYASLKDQPPVRLAKSPQRAEIALDKGKKLIDAVRS